ncbi:hypothetical protein [Chondromyces crocatus]|nr:hypothetical protein [Chondromyces crocatus]
MHATHATRKPRILLLLAVMGLASIGAGCEDGKPAQEAPPAASGAAAPPAASVSAGVSASASGLSASASAAAAAKAPLVEQWQGKYDAKKGVVTYPAKVSDKARQKDDGKVAAGPGTITLTIEPGGEVRGKAEGALGAATITGRFDDGALRASVNPNDPTDPAAMTGILTGQREGDVVRAMLRVAGPDALLVREAAVELRKAEAP